MLRIRFAQTLTIGLAAALCLAGCAPRGPLKERSTRDEVRASWGKPTLVQPRAAGERWVFATAPEGRVTWFVDFDEGGRLSNYLQVLTEERIQQVQPGLTQAEVEALLGPSYFTIRFPLKPEELTHIYRYMRPDAPICFYVQYDLGGKVISTGTRNDRVGNPGLERPCL